MAPLGVFANRKFFLDITKGLMDRSARYPNIRITGLIHKALFCIAAKNEKIVVTLTEEELSEMREAHANCTTPMQLRNKAIVLLGTKMGIRASDIVRIQVKDINWDEQTITFVQKKTSHEAMLPMPTAVGNAIYF